MTQDLLVVFGATGQQGGSVANYMVSDPELSKRYRVRGVTRDVSKPAAKALEAKGIEVVAADIADESTYASALEGAHTVFLMTTTAYEQNGKQKEVRQGKALADAAIAAGAQYIIFSSEVHALTVSGGALPVDSFDAKADVEQYIRQLPIKSAFFLPASFMQNLLTMMAPRKMEDGTYVLTNVVSSSTKLPWIDIVEDTGKFVGAVLAEPEKYSGKAFHAASGMHSFDEIVRLISQANGGKTVTYSAMEPEAFKAVLPPSAADPLVNMFLFFEQFGYYGPDQQVDWAINNARGKVIALEDYIAKNVKLD